MKDPLASLGIEPDEFIRAMAAVKDEERLRQRRKDALCLPKGTMLGRGDAPTILEAAKYFMAPLFIPGGVTGIRLFFAKMSDELRFWNAVGGATLDRTDEHFVLRAEDVRVPDLRLSFDGKVMKRVTRCDEGRTVELRQLSYRGTRLA